MPKFAANISFLFKKFTVPERIQAAADIGFKGVELLFPYDEPIPQVTRALSLAGIPMILINTPPPNYAGGERGFAAVPGGEQRFRHDFLRAVRYAETLKVGCIHVMAGAAEGQAARDTYVENLRWATAQAPKFMLTIEPINQQDMPGYFLSDFNLAADIIAEVGAPNIGLQFDSYHAQKITGDVMATWTEFGRLARHVQIAGLPDRAEPVGGPFDYPAFFDRLDADGYDGYVSAEYHPLEKSAKAFRWLTLAG